VYRFLYLLIVSWFFAAPAWAQGPADEADETQATEVDTEEIDTAEVEAVEIDETGLDEQGFSDEDDDFRPSEDIPADQSIAFPTDI
jgi:hypothetical protein